MLRFALLVMGVLLFATACGEDSPEDTVRAVLSGAGDRSFSAVSSLLTGPLLRTFLAGWGNAGYLDRFYSLLQPSAGLRPVFLRALYAANGHLVTLHFLLRNDAGRILGKRVWRLERVRGKGGWRLAAIQ